MDMSQLLMSMFGGAGQSSMPMPTVSPSQAGGPVAPSQQMPTGLDRMGQVGSLISGLGGAGQQALAAFEPTTTTAAPPVQQRPRGQHGENGDRNNDWKDAWHTAKEAWRTSRPAGAPGDDPALLAAFQAWRDARPDRHSFQGGGATNPGMPGMTTPGMMPPTPAPALTPPAAVAPSQAPMGGMDINALLQKIFSMGGGGAASINPLQGAV